MYFKVRPTSPTGRRDCTHPLREQPPGQGRPEEDNDQQHDRGGAGVTEGVEAERLLVDEDDKCRRGAGRAAEDGARRGDDVRLVEDLHRLDKPATTTKTT